jgi:hypothetical protein
LLTTTKIIPILLCLIDGACAGSRREVAKAKERERREGELSGVERDGELDGMRRSEEVELITVVNSGGG